MVLLTMDIQNTKTNHMKKLYSIDQIYYKNVIRNEPLWLILLFAFSKLIKKRLKLKKNWKNINKRSKKNSQGSQ